MKLRYIIGSIIFFACFCIISPSLAIPVTFSSQDGVRGTVVAWNLPSNGRYQEFTGTFPGTMDLPEGRTMIWLKTITRGNQSFVTIIKQPVTFKPSFPKMNSKGLITEWKYLIMSPTITSTDVRTMIASGQYAGFTYIRFSQDVSLESWKWTTINAYGGTFPYPTQQGYIIIFDPADGQFSSLVTAMGSKGVIAVPMVHVYDYSTKTRTKAFDYAYTNKVFWHEVLHGEGIDLQDQCSTEFTKFSAYCKALKLPVDISRGSDYVCGTSYCFTDNSGVSSCQSYIRDDYNIYYMMYLMQRYLNPLEK